MAKLKIISYNGIVLIFLFAYNKYTTKIEDTENV